MNPVRPLIAVPARLSDEAPPVRGAAVAVGRHYLEAIRRAGGEGCPLLPRVVEPGEMLDVMARFDGLVLHGGGDLDPSLFGATERHEKLYGINPIHDAFEMGALEAALTLDLPVLAICRGMQILNVARGGTLHQHITDDETTVHHRFELHGVQIDPSSKTAAALGTTSPAGYSVHHQSIDRVGEGLIVTGHAADGTIEAMELPDRWVVAVQWHPEDTAADDTEQQRLFDAVVEQARHRASARM